MGGLAVVRMEGLLASGRRVCAGFHGRRRGSPRRHGPPVRLVAFAVPVGQIGSSYQRTSWPLRRARPGRTAAARAGRAPAPARRSPPRPPGTWDCGHTGRARRRRGARSAPPAPACRRPPGRSARTQRRARPHRRRPQRSLLPAAAWRTAPTFAPASRSTTREPDRPQHPAPQRRTPHCLPPPSPCAYLHSPPVRTHRGCPARPAAARGRDLEPASLHLPTFGTTTGHHRRSTLASRKASDESIDDQLATVPRSSRWGPRRGWRGPQRERHFGSGGTGTTGRTLVDVLDPARIMSAAHRGARLKRGGYAVSARDVLQR